MKRYAAHYIYLGQSLILKQHFIELDEKNCITACLPLHSEIAGTEFHNGILFPIAQGLSISPKKIKEDLLLAWKESPEASVFELLNQLQIIGSRENRPVCMYHLDGIDLLTAKLRTGNGSGDCYIQRL